MGLEEQVSNNWIKNSLLAVMKLDNFNYFWSGQKKFRTSLLGSPLHSIASSLVHVGSK